MSPRPSSLRIVAVILAATVSASCAHLAPKAPVVDAAAVLAAPNRFEGDSANDTRRKAVETLNVLQLRAGDAVFEIEAGGGYWTELFATAVGPAGKVTMQNPAGFIPFVKDTLAKRFTPGRLSNVRQSISNFDALDAASASVDVVTWFQGPHELFYKPEGVNLGDPVKSYAEIARILKPGGVFVVVDHAAKAGAPPSSGNDLHRIDPALVIASAKAAGLTLEAQETFLLRAEDDLSKNVFDPAIRGKTSQFVLRFRKG
jgi:predicted methyltransferase